MALGDEFLVNAYTTGDQRDADVALAADGSFVVVWEMEDGLDGDRSGIFGRRFSAAGTTIGEDFQVNTFTLAYQRRPSIDMASAGNFIVAWADSGQDDPQGLYGSGVFAQRFGADATKTGAEFQVNTYTPGSQSSPSIAVQPSGGFVVLWTDDEQFSHISVVGQRFAANGSAAGGEFIANSYVESHKETPRVVSGSDGGFLAVWTSLEQDGSSRGVFGRQFGSDGTPVGSDFQVNSFTENSQYRSDIAIDASGNALVVWQQRESTPIDDVYGQRLKTDAATPACGDPVALVIDRQRARARLVTATDALFILRVAVGATSCELCVCDVNNSGGVSATDALIVLRAAVGQSENLQCPACVG